MNQVGSVTRFTVSCSTTIAAARLAEMLRGRLGPSVVNVDHYKVHVSVGYHSADTVPSMVVVAACIQELKL